MAPNRLIIPLLAIAVLGFPLLYPDSYWITVLIYVGIYGLIVVGYDLVLGYCSQVSLGHNGLFAIGAYTSAVATVWMGWSPVAGVFSGVGLTSLVAWLVGIPTLRLKGYYLAIATLGFGFIVESLIRAEYFGGSSGITHIPAFSLFGYAFDTDLRFYYLVWCVVIAAVVVCLIIGETALGRNMKAIHTDEDAAACMGINVARLKISTFVFSAGLAALAGSLYAHYSALVSPGSFGMMLSVKLLLMLYLGGAATVYGGVIGAFVLFAIPEVLGHMESLELAIEGLIFILILVFLPGGIVGALHSFLNFLGLKKAESVAGIGLSRSTSNDGTTPKAGSETHA